MAVNANALTTLNMAKTYLKIPLTETSQDTLVEFFINASSEMLERETDRKLKAQSIVDTVHGRSSNIVLLSQWPVNSITELRIDNSSDFVDASTLIDADEYRVGDDKNTLVLLSRTFPKGYNNVRVTFNAGYSTVPSDLEHACLWMVFFYHKIRIAEDIGRQSRSKGDESTSLLQEAPADVKNTILRYKRTEFPAANAPVWNV
jgi:uncharacterized phiE125 gp8 family phage protein